MTELMALLAKATAMNGETFAQTVDRIICEHSAWIGCPNKQVAEKIAFSALVRASAITERADSKEVTTLISERDALAKEVERLQKRLRPTLFWIDEDPEQGFCDIWEATEAALYHSNDEGVVAIREGCEVGITYVARLMAADDSDSYEWLKEFATEAEANAAIQAERDRRAALAGQP